MSKNSQKIPWLGIVLIVFGVSILLRKLHVIEVGFFTIFWLLMVLMGLVIAGRGFSANRRGKIFWGTVLFLYSLFFVLRSSEIIEIEAHVFAPATFIVVGIAFLMLFVNNTRDWFYIIPALLFAGTGTAFFLADYGYFYYWDIWSGVRMYWPVALILLGLGVIFRRRTEPPHM